MLIAYLDIEATGLDTSVDRIIEVSILLYEGNREIDSFSKLINPGVMISNEITQLCHISNEDVADQPPFPIIARSLLSFLDRADALAGFDLNFDLKILSSELFRCDQVLDVHSKRIFDMQKIFFKHEPRTLTAALKFYCDKNLDGAHRAEVDARATAEVFKAQQERYQLNLDDPNVRAYAEIKAPLDSNGAFQFNDQGGVVLRFGKHKDKIINTSDKEMLNYLSWMRGAKFPEDTKRIAAALSRGKTITPSNIKDILLGP